MHQSVFGYAMLSVTRLVQILLFALASRADVCSNFSSCDSCTAPSPCTSGQCVWCMSSNECLPLFNFCPLNDRVDLNFNCPVPTPEFNDTWVAETVPKLLCAANSGSKLLVEASLEQYFDDVTVAGYYSRPCLNSTSLFGSGSPIECAAYAALLNNDTASPLIVIAVSVTSGAADVSASLGNIFAPPKLVPFGLFGNLSQVYSVFDDTFSAMWTAGLKADYGSLLTTSSEAKTVVVGYSVGGAVALLVADAISQEFLGNGSTDLEAYTLGQPRVGDAVWAYTHDIAVPKTFRIISGLDPVPTQPARNPFGPSSYHARYEVWYPDGANSTTSNFTIFGQAESSKGRNSQIFGRDADHLSYFGTDFRKCSMPRSAPTKKLSMDPRFW